MKRFFPAALIAFAFLAGCAKESISVAGVTLSTKETSLLEGRTLQLKATLDPSNATIAETLWESSDESIADVDAYGLVKAVSEGSATIKVTVKATDGTSASASCTINVVGAQVNITALAMNVESYTLSVGQKVQLLVSATPSSASTKDIVWSSSSEKVARVSATGLVTAIAAGTSTIYASTPDGKVQASCTITVK